jgi:hypothetical protein
MDHRKRTIELPDDDSEALIIRGGIKVAFNSTGGVAVYTNGDVAIRPAVNDDAAPAVPTENAKPKIGDTMEDGTIFSGISPDTGRPIYTTPADAPLAMEWKRAMNYAADLDAHGHRDWKLPSKAELNVLFENRAKIGGFNTSGSFPAGYCWSSSEKDTSSACYQRFSDGVQRNYDKLVGLSVRCVRG